MARQDAQLSALDLADELVRSTGRVVGGDVVAQIVHGSLTTSDFAPGRSDVDLLVIVSVPLGDEQKARLADAVTTLTREHRAWLDYRVVTADSALHPQEVPKLDFGVGIHPGIADGIEVQRGPVDEPDLLYEFSICREGGRSLVGAVPAQLIGPVPNEWLLALGDAYLKRWQEVDYNERIAKLMVFTACRLWYRRVVGGHLTKSDAARWVIRQAPELVAPRRALARRTRDPDAIILQADVMTLLATVRTVLADHD